MVKAMLWLKFLAFEKTLISSWLYLWLTFVVPHWAFNFCINIKNLTKL